MMQTWTDDIIRFMSDASDFSDYFVKLADMLEPYLKGCRTICDAGCGLGQLSEELGKRGYTVYACDISEKAIGYIKNKKYKNVIPVLCNLKEWSPSFKFDSMIFNYFGSMDEITSVSKRCCNGITITLKKNYRFHRFSFTEKPINGYMSETAEEYFRRNNIKYEVKEFSAQFGQPFRSVEDAVEFFNIYSQDDDKSQINTYNVEKLLIKTDCNGFKYFLPKEKPSLVFITGDYNGNSIRRD